MHRLYIVEGLPGSGKTTLARMLADHLRARRDDVSLYVEGDLHPTDAAWCAVLTPDEMEWARAKFPEAMAMLDAHTVRDATRAIVAYTMVDGLPPALYQWLEAHEVYDNRVDTDVFCGLHQERWAAFGRRSVGTFVFECALLQNHVNEMTLFRNKTEQETGDFVRRLAQSVVALDPLLLYLSADPDAVLERAAAKRLDEQGGRVWEQRVSEYVAVSPYGRAHGLSGVSGMRSYFANRQKMELRILPTLPIATRIWPIDIHAQERCTEVLLDILKQEGHI